jgi:biotin transport system substrate-specific component
MSQQATKMTAFPAWWQSGMAAIAFAMTMAMGAQLDVPIPGASVSTTLQTVAVFLAGSTLGPRWGAGAVGIYLGMGALGLPVYAEGGSGLDHLFGATTGYLWGFVLAAWLCGEGVARGWTRSWGGALGLAALATTVILGLGALGLVLVAGMEASAAVERGVLPVLPGGVLKGVVCAGWWRWRDRIGDPVPSLTGDEHGR